MAGPRRSPNVRPRTGLQVTETDPGPLYALTNTTCTATSTATNVVTNATNAAVSGVPARTVRFDLAARQTLDCTFTNTRQRLAPTLATSPWIYPNDTATVTKNAAFSDITGKREVPSLRFRGELRGHDAERHR